MKIDFVPMKLVPGTTPPPVTIGQTVNVTFEGCEGETMEVPMRVVAVYEDGSWDGEVVWGEV